MNGQRGIASILHGNAILFEHVSHHCGRASIFLENSTLEKTKDFLKILGQGNQGIQGT